MIPTQPIRAAALMSLLLFAGCATPQANPVSQGTACSPAPMPFGADTAVIEMVHVTTGADGLSHGELTKMEGKTTVYLGATLRQFQLGDPSNVVIVTGPADFKLPAHAAPYREMFLLLAGSSVIQLSDGTEYPLRPGSAVLMEDTTGAGHGGRFGPCGYVALDLQFK
jgi:quercetin dioxygenase-like cupin family protein